MTLTTNLGWALVFSAGLLEPVWVYALTRSEGFTKPLWLIPAGLVVTVIFLCFSTSLRVLPMSTAYSVWAGVGALSVTACGLLCGDTLTATKFIFLSMILTGVIGLRFQ